MQNIFWSAGLTFFFYKKWKLVIELLSVFGVLSSNKMTFDIFEMTLAISVFLLKLHKAECPSADDIIMEN